jgi:hypothetical protein
MGPRPGQEDVPVLHWGLRFETTPIEILLFSQLLIQRTPDIFKTSSFITTTGTSLLILNVEMRQTFGDLSNSSLSTGDNGEQLFVDGGSGIKESITTVTPLSYLRTLRKKTRSSDLRADFFSDDLPVVKLPSSRRISTRGIQARVTRHKKCHWFLS